MPVFGRRAKRGLAELPIGEKGPKRRMLLVVNPYASTVSSRLKNVVIYALQSRYEVEAIDTRERNHATDIVREALDRKYDVVCSFGGDGTANEVVNGMAGTGVPFTFLPGGMTNVIGRILGIPNDIIDATEHLLTLADRWDPVDVDLGEVNGRAFLFGAGVGLDAEIVRVCENRPTLKARLGQNFYVGVAGGLFLSRYALRRSRFHVKAGDFECNAAVAVAQNSAPFTYFRKTPIMLAEGAGLETGSLALTVLDRANPLDLAPIAARLLSPRLSLEGARHVKTVDTVDEIVVTTRRKGLIPLQADGDYLGDFERVTFKARPKSLKVVA